MSILKNKIRAIVLLSFLVCIAYSFWHRIEPAVDAVAYDRIALNLLAGNGFREDSEVSFEFDTAMLRAGPGYEFFLSAIYAIFGHHYEAVWIIQALLHAATAYILYQSARRIWQNEEGDIIGLIAAAMIGFHPDLVEISAMLMTETLYLFFTALLIYLFSVLYSHRSWQVALILGVCLGCGILVRPTLLLCVPIILIFFILKKYWRESMLFLVTMILIMTPWTMRNYRMYGEFIPTTLIGDFNIWIGNTVRSNGGQISEGFNPVTTYLAEFGVRGLSQTAQKEFISFIQDKPGTFVELTSIRFVRYMSLIRPMGFWFYDQGISQVVFVILSLFSIAVLFITGFTGMIVSLIEKKEYLRWYLIALALTAPVPLLLTVVQSRYRFQIYPFLALFGAYCLTRIFQKNPIMWKWIKIIFIVLLVISLVDSVFFWPTIETRLQSLFNA